MLVPLTLATAGVVVAALVVYLVLVIVELRRTLRAVTAIADGLEAVRDHVGPLSEHLTTINGGLSALLDELQGCEARLERVAAVLGLPQAP